MKIEIGFFPMGMHYVRFMLSYITEDCKLVVGTCTMCRHCFGNNRGAEARSIHVSLIEQVESATISVLLVRFATFTEVCRLVVTNLRREFAHARNFLFKIPTKSCACANFRRKFVTTNLQTSVDI